MKVKKTLFAVAAVFALFFGSSTIRTYAQVLGNTITAGTATITMAASKVFTVNNTLTLNGTDGTTQTFPAVSASLSPTVSPLTASGGATVALTAAQCGQTFLFDSASGVIYQMPATQAPVGCTYDFYVTVSVTSNADEIETNNAAHFLIGAPTSVAAAATLVGACNGTTHIAYKTNGTTTGGLVGSHFRVTVLNATQAYIEGVNAGSGSLATGCSATN